MKNHIIKSVSTSRILEQPVKTQKQKTLSNTLQASKENVSLKKNINLLRGKLETVQLKSFANNSIIQRLTNIPVANHMFSVNSRPINEIAQQGGVFYKYGMYICITFKPGDDFGNDDDTISLIQSVKDTIKITDRKGSDITPSPSTSLKGTRELNSADGAEQNEIGYAIDQEVIDTNQQLTNLDPRYSEQRLSTNAPLNVSGLSPNLDSVRSAKKTAGQWSLAILNDEPGPSIRFPHLITGGMFFEVTAIHNQSNTYLGSIQWGFTIDKPTNNATITLMEPTFLSNNASPTFLKAAKKWNETQILNNTPMQLPIQNS